MPDLSSDQDKTAQTALLLKLAHSVLASYPVAIASVELINYEYNATFKVIAETGEIYALRINVNSKRSVPNVQGEIAFIQFLTQKTRLNVPVPIANSAGDFLVLAQPDSAENPMPCVLYSWLFGNEIGDEPTKAQMFALGAVMAQMHTATKEFTLPSNANLPSFQDVLWETDNNLTSSSSKLDVNTKALVDKIFGKIKVITDDLYSKTAPQVIHADLHGWNVMWHENEIAVFDFDDCGIGLPLQDLAVAIYYLDTEEQKTALLSGYQSIQELPSHTQLELDTLLIQRRLILLNYLYETKNPEHKELIPKYQEESLKRFSNYLLTYF